MNIKQSIITSLIFFLLFVSNTNASIINIILSSDGVGGTNFSINGSGEDHNNSANGGGGSSVMWANLNGGDPFKNSLSDAGFSLSTPLAFAPGVSLNGITLDNDGNNANSQDDIFLNFDDVFFLDDAFSILGSGTVLGLDFSLLNPGVYTRENVVASLTLTIAPTTVPVPSAILFFLPGLTFLYTLSNRRKNNLRLS